MRYTPTPTPSDSRQLRIWLAGELGRIANALAAVESTVTLEQLTAAPARPHDGMLVYADGVHWNPGAGVGFYGRQAGAWVKL